MPEPADLLLRNAVVHQAGGGTVDGWIAVTGGRIAAIGSGEAPAATDAIDCAGKQVIPGVVDIHTHFRDPGDPDKEDFTSGSLAAAFGGVTTVVDMPNTGHMVITPDDFREKRDYLAGRSWVDYGLHAVLVDSADYVEELRDLGVAGLKWLIGYPDWKGIPSQPSSNARLRETLQAAAAADVLVGVHAESLAWMADLKAELKAQGRDDVQAHPDSRPPFVEAIAVAEVAIMAAQFGGRMHIHHLTAEMPLRTAVALTEALGGRLTVETCPSYLFLTDEDVVEQGQIIQVNPPMRPRTDQDAMWAGIAARQIEVVASDHAPHHRDHKLGDTVWEIPPGVVAVETMLPLMLNEVTRGRLELRRVIELLCEKPAELVKMDDRKGGIAVGRDADLVVVDLEATTTIRGAALHSKPKFTPYEGRELGGAVTDVVLRGAPLVRAGELARERPGGEHVPASYAKTTAAA